MLHQYSKIMGTGSYLPEYILTNQELEKKIDTTDEWIVSRTGIKQRHILSENETSMTMATMAARRAIENAGIDANDIGLIIVATCTPENTFPSNACAVQFNLGIKTNCPAFDLSAACAGFNYALSMADNYIKCGLAKYALIIGSEALSRIMNWDDRNSCVLFGDGAGAVILGASEEPGVIATHLHADGKHKDLLYAANLQFNPSSQDSHTFLQMQGKEVFKVAVKALEELVEKIQQDYPEIKINWLVPHQANLRIISAVAKRLGLSEEQIIVTIDKQGNTSSASVPLALDTGIKDGRIKRGDYLLLESFGGGFTWGSALIKY